MAKTEPLRNTPAGRKSTSRAPSHQAQSPRFARYETPKRPIAGIITAQERYFGSIYNIGHTGAFFLNAEAVKTETVGKMGIEMPNWFFRANIIVRETKPGVGFNVEFIRMTSLDRQTLRMYLGELQRHKKASQDDSETKPDKK